MIDIGKIQFLKKIKNTGNGLVKNASLNVIRQICVLTFSLITFPYVSRTLGDASYGRYSFATTIIEYFLIFSSSAGGVYAIREGARLKNDKDKLNKFSSELFSIGCLFTLIAYIVLFGLIILWPKLYEYKEILLILSLRIFATTIGVEWIFNIFEDFENITIRQIVVQALGLLLTLVLVHSKDDANLYAVATVVAMSGANLVNFFIGRKYVNIRVVKSLNLKTHLKPILMIMFYSAMITIYSNADIIMLGVMTDDSVVGVYSVAAKIYGIVKGLFIAALTVLLPRMSSYLGNDDLNKLKIVINKTMNVLLIVLLPSIILLAFYAKTVISIIAGTNYLQGETSLQLLSVALMFALTGSLLTTNIMIPNRQENKITIIVSISAIGNILLNYFFIPFAGASAAALTTVLAELIVCIGAITYSKEYLDWKKIKSVFFKVCLSTVIMILILFAIKNLGLNYIMELIVGSAVSCIGYCLCLGLLVCQ